jgi:hypothetical protein
MGDQLPTKVAWYKFDYKGASDALLILCVVVLTNAKKVLGESWWFWLALPVAAFLALLLVWRLFRPLAGFVRQEGLVGCWRWLCEKIFLPVMYGKRGK